MMSNCNPAKNQMIAHRIVANHFAIFSKSVPFELSQLKTILINGVKAITFRISCTATPMQISSTSMPTV